jgi:hypothetical protein
MKTRPAIARRRPDLSIDDEPRLADLEHRVHNLGEVWSEALVVATSDVDMPSVTKDERAKAVPLRLVEKPSTRKTARELREHGLDRRLNDE